MAKEDDRVVSFSIPPSDKKSWAEVRKLKKHCKDTGKSFSFLVIQGVEHVNKKLKLRDQDGNVQEV